MEMAESGERPTPKWLIYTWTGKIQQSLANSAKLLNLGSYTCNIFNNQTALCTVVRNKTARK